jgi:DNA recombination protein RmuC
METLLGNMTIQFAMVCALLFLAGVAGGWAVSVLRTKRDEMALAELRARVQSGEELAIDLKRQIQEKDADIEEKRGAVEKERREKAVAEARMEEAARSIEDQKKLLEEAKTKLADTFRALSGDSLKSNNQAFIELAGSVMSPVKDALEKFEKVSRESYGAIDKKLDMFNQLQIGLQAETKNLSDALKRPQVRGRWGEITLKRVVETAGMSEYCDFTEQVSVDTEEGKQRPDLIVKLPGGRTVVVDAKAPLKAYLEAVEAADTKSREESLARHAQQVRDHMKLLGTKDYWKQFKPAPDFVVLFLPGESFFSAALEKDRELIVDGIANKVILATPTTLIALLRTVAYSWQQQHMAENAEKIAKAGEDLFDRICKFVEHLGDVRNNLENATHSFNKAVGSLESRLIPGARKLKELGAAPADKEIEEIEPINAVPRQLNIP